MCQENTFFEFSLGILRDGVQMYWKHTDFFSALNERVFNQEWGVENCEIGQNVEKKFSLILTILYSLFPESKPDCNHVLGYAIRRLLFELSQKKEVFWAFLLKTAKKVTYFAITQKVFIVKHQQAHGCNWLLIPEIMHIISLKSENLFSQKVLKAELN